MKLSGNYSGNDNKVNHALELMLNSSKFVEAEDIDMDYITENINKFIYKADDCNIKDITLASIDNIDCTVQINYKYLKKINEDRADIGYNDSCVNISFICYPEMLKKS